MIVVLWHYSRVLGVRSDSREGSLVCCYQAPDATNCSPVPAPLAAAEPQRQRERQQQLLLGAQRPRAERQLTPPGTPHSFSGSLSKLVLALAARAERGRGRVAYQYCGQAMRALVRIRVFESAPRGAEA